MMKPKRWTSRACRNRILACKSQDEHNEMWFNLSIRMYKANRQSFESGDPGYWLVAQFNYETFATEYEKLNPGKWIDEPEKYEYDELQEADI